MQTTYEHGIYKQWPHATCLSWEISLTYSTSYGKSIPHIFGVDLVTTYLIPRVPHRDTRSSGINLVPFSRRPHPVPTNTTATRKTNTPMMWKITRHALTLFVIKTVDVKYHMINMNMMLQFTSIIPNTTPKFWRVEPLTGTGFKSIKLKLGRVEPLTKAH